MSRSTARRISSLVVAVVAVALGGASPAAARSGAPPLSRTAGLPPLVQVGVLDLEPVEPAALLAEDKALAAENLAPAPLRFAVPSEVEVTPDSAGTWAELSSGGRVWRLRVSAPGATDLNFGFTTFDLAPGATLHVWSEDGGYFQGPYTAADASHDGDFWSPVVPGDRAVIELYQPADAPRPSRLVLGRVGRGYRDLFRRSTAAAAKAGSCNVDVVCPEADPWRDEVRSVGRYSVQGLYLCTGTMIMDVPGSFRPYFLTAYHCEVTASNDSSVVVYWNYESPTCGQHGGGTLGDNQSGATFRASRADVDFCLVELDQDPDPESNVYFAGWDAGTATAPQATVTIHHPQGDEKSIAFNNVPLTTGSSCIRSGPNGTHWYVDHYDLGTTEQGSSGSGLWDTATHQVVGFLSGGQASCSVISYDCYGKLAVAWDGASAALRARDWLDPADTGTRAVAGADAAGNETLRLVAATGADSCATGHGDANGVWEPGESVQLAVELAATGTFTGIRGTLTSQTAGVTVVDGSATWPALAAGGSATSNAPHFTFAIGGGVACDTPVALQLVVTANEGGPFSFPISGAVGANPAPDVPQPITDLSTVTSTLEVGQNVVLTDVNVHVEIDHTYVGDLVVSLRSPSGTSVTLLNRPSCGDNDMDVTFDDSSSVQLADHCAGTTPWYSGTAHPAQNLAAFNGQSSAGTWTLTVQDLAGGDSGILVDWGLETAPALSGQCEACGGGSAGEYVYHVAGIAHAPGAAGTNWRSKLSLLNLGAVTATVGVDYVRTSKVAAESISLGAGQLQAWDDVAVDLFGVSGSSSGAVRVDSSQPLVVLARTYNVGADGTYGQFLPGVLAADGLSYGATGVISQLVKSAAFRTNIGFVNLGDTASCRVRVTLHAAGGAAVGSPRTLTVPADGWNQVNDIFTAAGAGNRANAYATVEVLTAGCRVWGYGSVVDNATGDPTTIPLSVP